MLTIALLLTIVSVCLSVWTMIRMTDDHGRRINYLAVSLFLLGIAILLHSLPLGK